MIKQYIAYRTEEFPAAETRVVAHVVVAGVYPLQFAECAVRILTERRPENSDQQDGHFHPCRDGMQLLYQSGYCLHTLRCL